jgi:tryptophan synthase alpha chain
MSIALGAHLAALRATGRKLLVPYVMAGSTPGWLDTAAALVDAGADALEVGLPFSDPIIDGPVIQAAATAALTSGTTTASVTTALAEVDLGVPLIAMTYLNVLARGGYGGAGTLLSDAGMSGVIVPDLPLTELEAWRQVVSPAGVETVLLAAPSTSDARLDEVCARSEGFLYAVGRMATTGETDSLDPRGVALVAAMRHRTSLPILLGVGVSSPRHAEQASDVADGVVVGSAIVRRMLEGAPPEAIGAFARSIRSALDGDHASVR